MRGGLTELHDALAALLADVQPPTETVACPIAEAAQCVLSQPVVAPLDVPPWDNSAMDGYAVRARDVRANQVLPVTQRIAAGHAGERLQPGTAARIFTGAPLPPGSDAVVMQEDAEAVDAGVRICSRPQPGDNIRRRAQDTAAGDEILARGRRLRPPDLGVLASVGVASVIVHRPLRIGILSTGDELVEPGRALAPGQIYNANRYLLRALVTALGQQPIDLGIVPDEPDATAAMLTRAAGSCDLVISSGGVSVGEKDFVTRQIERLGELRLWRLAIKPGKPLAYGHIGATPLFGLPGNPAAVFVTFALVVRPYLLRMLGAVDVDPPRLRAPAGFERTVAESRREYLRARLATDPTGNPVVDIYANQSSGVLRSMSWANCLAVVPIGATVRRGEPVDVLPFDSLLH